MEGGTFSGWRPIDVEKEKKLSKTFMTVMGEHHENMQEDQRNIEKAALSIGVSTKGIRCKKAAVVQESLRNMDRAPAKCRLERRVLRRQYTVAKVAFEVEKT